MPGAHCAASLESGYLAPVLARGLGHLSTPDGAPHDVDQPPSDCSALRAHALFRRRSGDQWAQDIIDMMDR